MKKPLTCLCLLFAVVLSAALVPLTVTAQATCPVGASISLPDGFSVNVRSGPASTFPTVRNAVKAGETLTVLETAKDEQGRNWWRVGSGQWVIGQFWQVVCPSPVPSLSPSPTRTPTKPIPTPTRQVTNTPTPDVSGDPPILLTAIADGNTLIIPFYCVKACEGYVIVRQLP